LPVAGFSTDARSSPSRNRAQSVELPSASRSELVVTSKTAAAPARHINASTSAPAGSSRAANLQPGISRFLQQEFDARLAPELARVVAPLAVWHFDDLEANEGLLDRRPEWRGGEVRGPFTLLKLWDWGRGHWSAWWAFLREFYDDPPQSPAIEAAYDRRRASIPDLIVPQDGVTGNSTESGRKRLDECDDCPIAWVGRPEYSTSINTTRPREMPQLQALPGQQLAPSTQSGQAGICGRRHSTARRASVCGNPVKSRHLTAALRAGRIAAI